MANYRWLAVPLFLLFFFVAVDSLVGDSPTMDEQNHIARGMAFLKTADPRLSLEHPPLINALSSLPLLTLPDVRLPFDHPSWQRQPPDVYWYQFAEQFLWVYNHDVTRMVFLARLPVVFLTMGLGLVGYHFARQLWGRRAAWFALCFLLFDPNILANGRYATTDLGGALFVFLATFLLWRCWKRPSWGRWGWAALGMGLAFGSKLSTLTFVPIWGVLAIFSALEEPRFGNRAYQVGKHLFLLGSAGLASIGVVWAIFGFEWGQFLFRTSELAVWNGWQGPMPTFWAGIEQILNVSSGGRPGFLLGQFSNEGFLAYFPVALAVKTPLVVLGGGLISAVLLTITPSTRHKALFLLISAVLYFGFSMQSSLNIGYRHLLPMLPFLHLLVAGLAEWRLEISDWRAVNLQSLISNLHLLPIVVAVGLITAVFTIHPHYLSYFNGLAGGPENGYNILIDSNIDWGQDLLRLKTWMAENNVAEIKLGWFGTADPDYYGIANQPLPGVGLHKHYSLWGNLPFNPQAPEPGIYAISVTSLWELPLPNDQKYVYPWFRARPPDHRIGYSILIYEIP